MANDAGGPEWLARLNAQARRIAEQIRASGFEPEPADVAQRVQEAETRRAARQRLATQRRIETGVRPATARTQRARILGIREDTGLGKRGVYVASLVVYADHHTMTPQQARHNKTFQYWYKILREQENRLIAGKPVSRDPRGLYALALRKLGYKSDMVYAVGMSPTFAE